MDEDFSRQTRRFSAAILTYGKGNRRSMAGKRPARRCAAVVNTGSKSLAIKYARTAFIFCVILRCFFLPGVSTPAKNLTAQSAHA